MEKTILVDNKPVRMRASALVPRLYRFQFGRDLIKDLNQLQKAYTNAIKAAESAKTEEERQDAQLSAMDLTIFENLAYIMARHADNTLPNTPEEWLEGFSMFSIYEVLPEILALWEDSSATTSVVKKK